MVEVGGIIVWQQLARHAFGQRVTAITLLKNKAINISRLLSSFGHALSKSRPYLQPGLLAGRQKNVWKRASKYKKALYVS